MSQIFISYRRADTRWPTGRLCDHLMARFGTDAIFIDITTIEPGEDFVEAIENAINQSRVLLAMIGMRWLDATDADGRRRLDDPLDFVRLEIAGALRAGLRVIPVLVDEAKMPRPDELPDELAALARRQAARLRNETFHHDVSLLTTAIERALNVPAQMVMAGHWLDDARRMPTFFRQVRDRVVGFYGIDDHPKVGVYLGTIDGQHCDLTWRLLDGSTHGTARVHATASPDTLQLTDVWAGTYEMENYARTFHFVSDAMPTWVDSDDFAPYAEFLAGGQAP